MMARNTNVPFKGRIQKRKTHDLQIITFGLQRAAGPYRWATSVALCNRRPPVNFRYTPLATDVAMGMDWPLPSPRCTTSLQLQTI